jgi:hypothetical protein
MVESPEGSSGPHRPQPRSPVSGSPVASDRCGQPESHGAEAPSSATARLVEPDGCAAHIWCYPRPRRRSPRPPRLVDFLHHRLRLISDRWRVGKGCALPIVDLLHPAVTRRGLHFPSVARVSAITWFNFRSTCFTSPTIGTSGARFCPTRPGRCPRGHLGVPREGLQASSHPVVEPHPERDQ